MTSAAAIGNGPSDAEIEVSVFGPGKGESVAVHLGGGDWLTVDSCRDQITGEHPLLAYFDEIKVDASSSVRLVVGTHAHDDHIAGISDIYEAASAAVFVTSSALTSTEFFASVEADADIREQLRLSVRNEYRLVFDEAARRGLIGGTTSPIHRAVEQQELWSRAATAGLPGARVVALSPSQTAVQRSLAILAEGAASVDSRKRLSAGDPNEYAIALWVEVGDVAILLGADLTVGPAGCGWTAVLSSHHPRLNASYFKIPHHGSPNAHAERVWTELLTQEPVAVTAPFRGGRTPRPDAADVSRILRFTPDAFLTARSKLPAQPKSVRRTKEMLSSVATNVREPFGRAGQVRARAEIAAGDWTIETFSPAHQLP